MERLNTILHELGITKVKLAKFLGVSRQMIYNYLDLDDINKWPKDKRVMMFNLLGIKSASQLDDIKVDTDYILDVESRIDTLSPVNKQNQSYLQNNIYKGLSEEKSQLLSNIISIVKERLEDNNLDGYYMIKYLYSFLQSLDNVDELKFILGYFSKMSGSTKPMEFVFDEDEDQFIYESILFLTSTLYENRKQLNKTKITKLHKRFVKKIEQRLEEKLSRTLELNNIKAQALKELGYKEINNTNASEILYKIAEIESRKSGS